VDIFGESLLNDYTSQSPPQPFIIIMKQKTFNEMTKEEMKEREREMKKRLMKETRELDREIYKVESMKKQAEDKLKKEVAKGT
jgi:F0F1-type ATP synthase alpha subunit